MVITLCCPLLCQLRSLDPPFQGSNSLEVLGQVPALKSKPLWRLIGLTVSQLLEQGLGPSQNQGPPQPEGFSEEGLPSPCACESAWLSAIPPLPLPRATYVSDGTVPTLSSACCRHSRRRGQRQTEHSRKCHFEDKNGNQSAKTKRLRETRPFDGFGVLQIDYSVNWLPANCLVTEREARQSW